METHNAFAGQGAVVLDIGGDIGALVVQMPTELEGVEIEIRPVVLAEHGQEDPRRADHGHDHLHDHAHDHAHESTHAHPHDHARPHVAVVERPTANGPSASIVFGELRGGEYELYERFDEQVRLRVLIHGGAVTEANWPGVSRLVG